MAIGVIILLWEKKGYPAVQWKNDTFTMTFPYPFEQVTPQVEARDR